MNQRSPDVGQGFFCLGGQGGSDIAASKRKGASRRKPSGISVLEPGGSRCSATEKRNPLYGKADLATEDTHPPVEYTQDMGHECRGHLRNARDASGVAFMQVEMQLSRIIISEIQEQQVILSLIHI